MGLLDNTKLIAKKRGLSLTQVAIKAGIGEKSIHSWDRSNPKAENLEKVADVLNVSTDYLLGREAPAQPDDQPDIKDTAVPLAFDGKEIEPEERDAMIEWLEFRRYQQRNKK